VRREGSAISAIELAQVAKRYGATPVLINIGLTVPDGSVIAVLGASGSGKTTLLRLIAGFEHVDAGTITIVGHMVDDGHRASSPNTATWATCPRTAPCFPTSP
jgi:iron(III) transport system ATP-binding protein